MTVFELEKLLNSIAPRDLMWAGDNCGLLVGEGGIPVAGVCVALDLSLDVIADAARHGENVIVTHHPVIFDPVRRVTAETAVGRRIIALCRAGIAHIAAHTNLDAALVNDELARVLGFENVEIYANAPGDYLRVGTLAPQSVREYAAALKIPGLRYHDAGVPVTRAMCGSGGSGDNFARAIAAGCDTYISGDIKHDVFCDARDMGLNLIDATHFYTENVCCEPLARILRGHGVNARVSEFSAAPYSVI